MEPVLITDPALNDVLHELIDREPIFHRHEHGTTRADFEGMMAEDFWEVGASGRRYSREFVLDILDQRREHPPEKDAWVTSDFWCHDLGPETYLLTYTLRQEIRKTRRATIWQRTASGWKIVFHQGTICE